MLQDPWERYFYSQRGLESVYAQVYVGEEKLDEPLQVHAAINPSNLVSDLIMHNISLVHCKASQMSVYPPGTPVPPPSGVQPLTKEESFTQETSNANPFVVIAPEASDDKRLLGNLYCRKKGIRTITDLVKSHSKLAQLKNEFREYIINKNDLRIECFPKDWLDDTEVLHSLYERYGYGDAPLELQANAKFYKICKRYYHGQEKIDNMGWKEKIPNLAKQNVDIVMKALDDSDVEAWDDIPKKVQMVPRVAWRAKCRGLVKIEDLKEYLLISEALKVGLESGDAEIHDVPEDFQNNLDFFKSLTKFSFDTAKRILEAHPTLGRDVSFWYALQRFYIGDSTKYNLHHGGWSGNDKLVDLLSAHGIPDLLSNTEFWDKLLFIGPDINALNIKKVLKVANSSIWDNRQFVSKVLSKTFTFCSYGTEEQCTTVSIIPREKHVTYVELIKERILSLSRNWGNYDSKGLIILANELASELWEDRSVLQTWFKDAGNPFVENIHLSLRKDKEVFLWIAKHCQWTCQFEKADSMLLQDRSFVTKALAMNNGCIYRDFFKSGIWENENEYELYFFACGSPHNHREFVKDFMTKKKVTKNYVLVHIQELIKFVIVRLCIAFGNYCRKRKRNYNCDCIVMEDNDLCARALRGLQVLEGFIIQSSDKENTQT